MRNALSTFAIALGVFALVPVTAPAPAYSDGGEFSEGSNAKSWNLAGEEKARFSGTVVDILCELTGNCPANCGDGNRLLGIVRDQDNALILVSKNGQTSFNGGAADLLPHCGANIEVDGLLIGDSEETKLEAKMFQVQRIRQEGGDWKKANKWTKAWAKKNPTAKGKGAWFRRDPRVKQQIAEDGYLGLGKAVDDAYIEENF